MPCKSWSAKDHEVDLEILVADTLWSASSVSHITAWLWKKSLNIWVKTETSHLVWAADSPLKGFNIFVYLPVSLASSAFRCAYCYFLNPARKMRPQAPKLPEFSFEKRLRTESNTPEPAPRSATDAKESAPPSGGINKQMCMKAVVSFICGWKFIQMLGLWNKKRIKMSSRGDPLRHSHIPMYHFFCVLTACVQYLHTSILPVFIWFFSPNLMSDCILLWLWESAEVRLAFPV